MYSGWEPCVKQNIPMFRFTQRFRAAEWETRGCPPSGIASEALRGVQNIMTMCLRTNGLLYRPVKKELKRMLCLAFAPGEYMMIGDSVVVQMEKITALRFLWECIICSLQHQGFFCAFF